MTSEQKTMLVAPGDAGADHVPAALRASIEQQLRGRIVRAVPRAGNGASRQGAQLTIEFDSAGGTQGYLSFDTRLGDPRREGPFRREVAILSALQTDFAAAGVPAPRLLAHDKAHLALLTEFVVGEDNFERDASAESREAAELDLIRQLVKLHSIDPCGVKLDGFDDPTTPNSVRIANRLAELSADNLATAPDPILLLALSWLRDNIPQDRGPSVIVHGDAGPGNFLHHQGNVTALLDWELVHFGDPMEDLAQIWVRTMFNPFMPPARVFEAYEAAGGAAIDIPRIKYHRLYFQLSFMVANHANLHGPEPTPTALIGTTLLFEAAHMHVVVRSLAEMSGMALQDPQLDVLPQGGLDRIYEIALEDIRTVIAPRASDQQARAKATSLARLVKFWRNRERFGAAYDRAETDEISQALKRTFTSLSDARLQLAHAIAGGDIGFETALQLCNARVVRYTALMGEAMGSLKDCYFAPLD